MGATYENYISAIPTSVDHLDTPVSPTSFGQDGTAVFAGAHDHLEIGGNLTWAGGAIQVIEVESFSPLAGDLFNLADWYGVADWDGFNVGSSRYLIGNGDDNGDLNLPDLSMFDETLRWDTGLWASHGLLIIAITPEPTRAVLLLLGLIAIGFRRRR